MRTTKPILLAFALLTLPAIAQTPTLKVYSRETIVDVTVTDAKGNPVHGLKQEDFTLKEDNKPQPIRSFEEFGHAPPSSPPPKLPPNVYTNLQPPPSSSAVNILLLDGLNTAPPDATVPQEVAWSFTIQNRVKQEAAKYLASMPRGTRVAILGLSRGLRELQAVSTDPALLAAAVDTMEINMDGRASTPPEWCGQQDMRNQMTLDALKQIASDAAAIKGKKNLIWFSAGFPTITDPRVNMQPVCNLGNEQALHPQGMSPHGATPQLQGEGLRDYAPALLKVYGLLAAAQIAVFPIGAQALGTIANPIAPSLVGVEAPTYGEYSADDNLSLESMAEATGGAAYYNTNDLAGAVSKAIERGANYYTISYVPPGTKYDYSHHTIKLAVDRPDLHLVYRQTYDAVDPATIKPAPGLTLATTLPAPNLTDRQAIMRAAMSRNMPLSTDLLFDVQVEPSTEPAQPTDPPIFGALDAKLAAQYAKNPSLLTRYSFEYALPARQLTFTPTSEGNLMKASLEFDLAAYDAEGKLITSLSQSIQPNLTPEHHQQLLKGPFRFFQQLDLPAGALFLRIGILDATSTKLGTVEIPLTVLKKVVIKDMANPPPPRFDAP
jgi:VWFA-related protein